MIESTNVTHHKNESKPAVNYWSDSLISLLEQDLGETKGSLTSIKLKPLSHQLLQGAISSATSIGQDKELYNISHYLFATAGAKRINQIYFGIIDGKMGSLKELEVPYSPTTVKMHRVNVEVRDVIMAYLLSVALQERIGLLCNRMYIGLHNRWLKRYRSVVAHTLIAYHRNNTATVCATVQANKPVSPLVTNSVYYRNMGMKPVIN